jgi:hypothetical protein
MVDWLTVFYTSIPWATLLLVLLYIFKNPEKAEKWYSILARVGSYFSEKSERAHVASDIQSDINLFSKTVNLEAYEPLMPDGIKIEWVKGKMTREAFLRDNKVIVRMNHHRNQARNFLNAALSYVTTGLISYARHHLDSIVLRALDFTMVRKILTENKRNTALQLFYEEVYEPEKTREPSIEKYHSTMDALDEQGLLTRLLLREFSDLGLKMYQRAPNDAVKEETRRFVEFLDKIATKEPRVDVPLDFEGDKIRSSIILIARPEIRRQKRITPYITQILKCVKNGANTIYVCARGKSVPIAKDVAKAFEDSPILRKVAELEHKLPFYKGRRTDAVVIIFKSTPKELGDLLR